MKSKQRLKSKDTGNHEAAAVDAYLGALSDEARAGLNLLRKRIAAVVPDAVQGISYGVPAFRWHGRPLVWFAAFKSHSSFFPAANAIRVHAAALKGYKTSKGTIQFPHGKPPPARLIAKLVKTRLADLQGAKVKNTGRASEKASRGKGG